MLMARAPRPAKRGEGGPDPERGEGEGPGEGPLDNGCPSIHGQNLPCDVRRGVRGEEDGHAFELAGVADARDRVARFERRLYVRDDRVGEPRVKKTRRD